MPKTLRDLLAAVSADSILAATGDQDTLIRAPVVESSREIEQGGLFVARQGQSADGHDYIPDAIAAGAAAIVGEKPLADLPVPYIQIRAAGAALGHLAAAWHDFPSRDMVVIGITGTDGKTTTLHLLHSILQRAPGIVPGYISTLAADFGDAASATGLHVTTPGAPQVQRWLARMRKAGCTHCILEMTSHGLAQGRLNGVDIDLAILTNIMHEHLDYHGSWEEYRAAKARMFRMLSRSWRKPGIAKTAIVNADDPSADFFAAIPADAHIFYSLRQAADYRAEDIRHRADAATFRVCGQPIDMQLLGDFNIANALAAIGAARQLEVDWEVIRQGIAAVELVSGRMQRIDGGQDFLALVDFAHTPNALKRALTACRGLVGERGRLIAVFGSAGLRDVQKRRLMAECSAQLADLTILTAEDPRTESLAAILEMMAAGCRAQGGAEGADFLRIPDRGAAMYEACKLARAGDVVVVCGKGHEQSMCFGKTEYPWDDREALRAALAGAPLSTLPTATDAAHAAH